LPIIIVGQNIQAKASDERAIATYDDAGAILEETKQIQEHLKAQDATISDLTAQLKKLSK
jgi:prefoldin subunit 5